MAMEDDKAGETRLERAIEVQRAKLSGACAVQRCLCEVLLYAEGEDAVMYAEAAHVVAALMDDVIDQLDPFHLGSLNGTEEGGPAGAD